MDVLPNGTPIDLDKLEWSAQRSDSSSDEYLCLDTGTIITLSELEAEEREEIIEGDQHVRIPRISSDDAYAWREAFVAQAVAPGNREAAQCLSRALQGKGQGKGPFRRFKDALHLLGDTWVQQWYQWEEQHLHDLLHSWLESLPPDSKTLP